MSEAQIIARAASRLESAATDLSPALDQMTAALSMAISLKRIADRLDDIASGTATIIIDTRSL